MAEAEGKDERMMSDYDYTYLYSDPGSRFLAQNYGVKSPGLWRQMPVDKADGVERWIFPTFVRRWPLD